MTLSHSLRLAVTIYGCTLIASQATHANEPTEPTQINDKPEFVFEAKDNIEYTDNYYADNWGLGIGLRRADIAFDVEDTEVYDIMPLFYFEGENFFLRGTEGGVHLWKNEQHEVNIYSRFRFVDIPKELQNDIQAAAYDFGVQYQFNHGNWQADIALLSDTSKRGYAYSRAKYYWEANDWELIPYAELKWKSADFNEYYYGIAQFDPSAGVSLNLGTNIKYHVASNLYLLGRIGVTRLEDTIYDLPSVDSRFQAESFLGFGFFPDKKNSQANRPVRKETGEYLRLAHGWATPSNLGDILTGNTQKDKYNNQLTSLFYGYPVTDSLFTLPIELYLTLGGVWHHDSEVQDNIAEGVLGFKAYYTFTFGPRWRLGVAEGLSYVSKATYIEENDLQDKEFEASKLLNYLDFSLDVNLGDIFNQHSMRNLWLGASIHHRSGIFETSSAFGRIKGGSNYNSVYLQWHF
ncbi:MipA/OmpV family protein [Shewanella maritima]|uniref:MipA/OmpV family protein n=1 Tax=Shewanella maritima TaxID=2520507 RepID=UPI0037359CC7